MIMTEKEDRAGGFFCLNNTDHSFKHRSNDVFSTLGTIEAKHEAQQKTQQPITLDDDDYDVSTVVESEVKSTENVFKVPLSVAPKKQNQTPRDVSKWIHYDLSDVDVSSPGANTAAAMAFLQRKSQKMASNLSSEESASTKHVFHKPAPKTGVPEKINPEKPESMTNKHGQINLEYEDDATPDEVKSLTVISKKKAVKNKRRHFRERQDSSDEEEMEKRQCTEVTKSEEKEAAEENTDEDENSSDEEDDDGLT